VSALLAFLVFVNAGYALRSLWIALRSKAQLTPAPAPRDAPPVTIIVPARNEARQIEPCVRSLLAQDYPEFNVIVVDDRSEDETAAIVSRLTIEDMRLRLVEGEPLPADWVGKPWALAQGSYHAAGEWILFTDADTVHEPGALAASMAYARAHELDVLSVLTDQVTVTAAERIFLPSILWTIGFAIGSLHAINDPRREAALFNGQYIFARRSAYRAIGGHESVRAEIAEDLELARRFKADGRFRTALAGADGLVRVRMYRSFREIWEGFVKNFALGARDRPVFAAVGMLLLACVAPVTPIAVLILLAGGRWTAALVLAGSASAAIAAAAFGMSRLGLGARSALWLPLGLSSVIAIFCTSVVQHARGRVTWRGRRYA